MSVFLDYGTKHDFFEILDGYQNGKKSIIPHILEASSNCEYLKDTIIKYVECGFNATKAANKLHVHRNTLDNRMTTMTEKLHVDLSVNKNILTVYFILMCEEMFNGKF